MGRVKEDVINLCANFITSINIITDTLKACKIKSEEVQTKCLDVCDKGSISCLECCHLHVQNSLRIGQDGSELYRYESRDVQVNIINLANLITTHLNFQIVGNVATVFVQGLTSTVTTNPPSIPYIMIALPEVLVSVINPSIIPQTPITVINTVSGAQTTSMGIVQYNLLGNKPFLFVYPSLNTTNSTVSFAGTAGFNSFCYVYPVSTSGALKEAQLRGLVPLERVRNLSGSFERNRFLHDRFIAFGELSF